MSDVDRCPEPTTEADRFWLKVDKHGPLPDYAPQLGPCWLWTASLTAHGYSQFWDGQTVALAHRWVYEQAHGSIPDGLELDHLCRVPSCVNHEHLEPVTHHENILSGEGGLHQRIKTHCPDGHPYDDENTYLHPRGSRVCRECNRKRCRVWYAKGVKEAI